ncbi:MAG: TonB-dependent receptor plug domain-containing protein [Ignavibacteria bacterium]
MKKLVACSLAFALAPHAFAEAGAGAAVSEHDYFEELPVVLSVSRLAQPLDETPGAVTVIDRDTIRRLGARDIYDVLRIVPGFLVSGWSGASPIAAYHNVVDQVGSKLQVFIDGRSVYSTFFLGGTQRGLQSVILEDVERIEVLRGSNSAAYGANAFLGVVNIVTRHTADTRGALVSVTGGQRGVNDNTVRYGWGSDDASFRISTAHRADSGRDALYDESRVGMLNLRADLRPSLRDEVMLEAGVQYVSWGDGDPTSFGNPQRTPMMREQHLLGEWRRVLSPGEDVRVSFSHDDEYFRDRTAYGNPAPIFNGVFLDWGGRALRTQAELQHSFTPAAGMRAVWGTTLRDERVWSPPLYYGQGWITAQQWRLFGNLEWRPQRDWVVNAGGMFEKTSTVGSAFSPRLMVNYHVVPGQTVRAGVTKSQRVPTLFEEKADVRYFNALGMMLQQTWHMTGAVKPENLMVREVGYLGEFRPLGLTVDVRGFNEVITDQVRTQGWQKVNDPETLLIRGYEFQARWQPTPTTRIWWSHTATRSIWPNPSDTVSYSSPDHADSIAIFQALPHDWDATIVYADVAKMVWNARTEVVPAHHRIDVRLAKRFLVGTTRAEAAVTVQAANGSQPEFVPTQTFSRRAFATLRLEY